MAGPPGLEHEAFYALWLKPFRAGQAASSAFITAAAETGGLFPWAKPHLKNRPDQEGQ
jgi:hypothetical protein